MISSEVDKGSIEMRYQQNCLVTSLKHATHLALAIKVHEAIGLATHRRVEHQLFQVVAGVT
jgi:hypothetical protein